MHVSLSLLFLFIGSTSAKKQGDFGIFSACITKNKSIRLDCYYENCSKSEFEPFDCEFKMSNGSLLAKASNEMCRHILPEHHQLYANETMTTYNCTLTRRKRKEKKEITIDYSSIRKGQKPIKPCSDTTGLQLHRAPTLLWPGVILSLWRVLASYSQTA